MKCDCKDWHWVKDIDGFITLGWTHGSEYKGPPFKYCPWCGKRLDAKREEWRDGYTYGT